MTVIKPPGGRQGTRRVWADSKGILWITGWDSGNLLRYDPATGEFARFAVPTRGAAVRQLLGRRGEVWGAESGADKLVVIGF